MSSEPPRIAVLRPADGRLSATAERLRSLGAEPVVDPMLEIVPTGALPRSDADIVILTSTTGAELVGEGDWDPGAARIVAIGPSTEESLREQGFSVDMIPEEYSSAGLVSALAQTVPGKRVEVARSDHGSDTLLTGLADAGGYVHETALYRLTRPEGSGESVRRAVNGELDGVLFTSSLTIEHFLEAAEAQGVRAETLTALNESVVVGAIGEPTRERAAAHGIGVDVVPDRADVEALATAVVEAAR